MIEVSKVSLSKQCEQLALEVIRSGRLAQGPMVADLEEGFRKLCGTAHAVAVMNGTVALVAAFRSLGIGPGDEVITSPFTFVATVNAILETGATVRFADIGEDFCIDPDRIGELINPRTRAIVPVHLYGQIAQMSRIETIAVKHDLEIVEDAAQAHLSAENGRVAGSFGLGCFSLYATKNLASGEGGLITTDRDDLASTLRLLRNQGMRERYAYEAVGYNWRMTELQAAVALGELHILSNNTRQRASNAKRLSEGLQGIRGLELPSDFPGRRHVWHQYTVRVTEDARVSRERLVDRLSDLGVGSGIYYPRVVFDYACYRENDRVIESAVPVASRYAKQVVSLPVHPHLLDGEIEVICAAMRTVLD